MTALPGWGGTHGKLSPALARRHQAGSLTGGANDSFGTKTSVMTEGGRAKRGWRRLLSYVLPTLAVLGISLLKPTEVFHLTLWDLLAGVARWINALPYALWNEVTWIGGAMWQSVDFPFAVYHAIQSRPSEVWHDLLSRQGVYTAVLAAFWAAVVSFQGLRQHWRERSGGAFVLFLLAILPSSCIVDDYGKYRTSPEYSLGSKESKRIALTDMMRNLSIRIRDGHGECRSEPNREWDSVMLCSMDFSPLDPRHWLENWRVHACTSGLFRSDLGGPILTPNAPWAWIRRASDNKAVVSRHYELTYSSPWWARERVACADVDLEVQLNDFGGDILKVMGKTTQ